MTKYFWMFACIAVLTFTACDGKGSGGTNDSVSEEYKLDETGDVVLTFLMWGTPEEKTAVYSVLKRFQTVQKEKGEPIGLKVISVDSLSYSDKLQTMFAGGTYPDVFYLHIQDFFKYASKGNLAPLDDYIKDEDFNAGDFYPQLMNAFTFEGTLFGVPKDWTSFVLYYNMDMFDKAGVAYPNDTWTWDDFLAAAKKLTIDVNGDKKIDQYGFIIETWADWYNSWIMQNDGMIFDDKGNWVFSRGANVDKNALAIQFVADLINVVGVAPSVDQSRQLGGGEAFMSGRVAMCMYGRWQMQKFKKVKDFRWNYAVLPYKVKKASTVVTVSLAIASQSPNKDAAWKLLKFVTSYEGQIFNAEAGTGVPSRISLVESDHYLKAPEVIKFQPHLAMKSSKADPFIIQLAYAKFAPANPYWLEVRQKMDEQFDEVFLGKQQAKDVILRLDKIINDIIEPQAIENIQVSE
jgi:multiple sugar transport system substrate-binding protein